MINTIGNVYNNYSKNTNIYNSVQRLDLIILGLEAKIKKFISNISPVKLEWWKNRAFAQYD